METSCRFRLSHAHSPAFKTLAGKLDYLDSNRLFGQQSELLALFLEKPLGFIKSSLWGLPFAYGRPFSMQLLVQFSFQFDVNLVEPTRFELATSALRTQRSPS
jgi:hypothetical protein